MNNDKKHSIFDDVIEFRSLNMLMIVNTQFVQILSQYLIKFKQLTIEPNACVVFTCIQIWAAHRFEVNQIKCI